MAVLPVSLEPGTLCTLQYACPVAWLHAAKVTCAIHVAKSQMLHCSPSSITRSFVACRSYSDQTMKGANPYLTDSRIKCIEGQVTTQPSVEAK